MKEAIGVVFLVLKYSIEYGKLFVLAFARFSSLVDLRGNGYQQASPQKSRKVSLAFSLAAVLALWVAIRSISSLSGILSGKLHGWGAL